MTLVANHQFGQHGGFAEVDVPLGQILSTSILVPSSGVGSS